MMQVKFQMADGFGILANSPTLSQTCISQRLFVYEIAAAVVNTMSLLPAVHVCVCLSQAERQYSTDVCTALSNYCIQKTMR